MDTAQPLVSIIVLAYNSAPYIIGTLESIKAQTYQNIELLISDDCSADKTVEVVKDWVEKFKSRFTRVVVLTTPVNTGIPANSNRGVKAAKGEWIKFIAGDDQLLESCIWSNVDKVTAHTEIKLLTSNVRYMNEQGVGITVKRNRLETLREYFFTLPLSQQLKEYARLPVFLNSPSWFIKASLIADVNYFDEDFFIYEDMPFIYKVLEKGIKIEHFNEETVRYRISDKTISRSKNSVIGSIKAKEQKKCFLKYRKKHLSKTNLIDLSVFYEFWLEYSYKGFLGIKGLSLFKKLSIYYWYLGYIKISSKA